MYRVLAGVFLTVGVSLMLLGVSYFVMVLFGMVWDWGKFLAAIIIFVIGILGTCQGYDMVIKEEKERRPYR